MNVLILKLGATGDVVRTTPLLRRMSGQFTWITATKNTMFVDGIAPNVRVFSWEDRDSALDRDYDLLINLEDTLDVAEFAKRAKVGRVFGAYANASNQLEYSDDSKQWFDLSLISRFGKDQADKLKLQNRQAYQNLIFSGLGFSFNNESYLLPKATPTDLRGDVAIAKEAGPVWPMKNWAYYDQLKTKLEAEGLKVNYLPRRPTLLEHLADVQNHRCIVGGDSLPMHLALGSNIKTIALFTCTSPWEIHDYGILTKIISPLLEEFFYKRNFDVRATTAISLDEVFAATMNQLDLARE